MKQIVQTYEAYNATFSLQCIGEFAYTTADGNYFLKVFEENCFLLILPNGKHFIADHEFLYDPGDNHLLDQYKDGRVKNWIIGCIQSYFNSKQVQIKPSLEA